MLLFVLLTDSVTVTLPVVAALLAVPVTVPVVAALLAVPVTLPVVAALLAVTVEIKKTDDPLRIIPKKPQVLSQHCAVEVSYQCFVFGNVLCIHLVCRYHVSNYDQHIGVNKLGFSRICFG